MLDEKKWLVIGNNAYGNSHCSSSDNSSDVVNIPLHLLGTNYPLTFNPDKKLRSYNQVLPLDYFTKIIGNYFFIDDYLNNSIALKHLIDSNNNSKIKSNNNSIYRMPLKYWYRFKSQPCRRWQNDHSCKYGKQCWYYHDDEEQIRMDWCDIGCATTLRKIHSFPSSLSKSLLLLQNNNNTCCSEVISTWYCSFGCINEETCHHHCLFYQTLINLTGRSLPSLISNIHPSLLSIINNNKDENNRNIKQKQRPMISPTHISIINDNYISNNNYCNNNYNNDNISNYDDNNNNFNYNVDDWDNDIKMRNSEDNNNNNFCLLDEYLHICDYARLPIFISLSGKY
jgi:hypothetical protein